MSAPNRPLVGKDKYLFYKIRLAISPSGKRAASEHFKSNSVEVLGNKWECWHLHFYVLNINARIKENKLAGVNESGVNKALRDKNCLYSFSHLMQRSLYSDKGLGKEKSKSIFYGLWQGIRKTPLEGLLDFLIFCKDAGRPLAVFNYEESGLITEIEDIQAHPEGRPLEDSAQDRPNQTSDTSGISPESDDGQSRGASGDTYSLNLKSPPVVENNINRYVDQEITDVGREEEQEKSVDDLEEPSDHVVETKHRNVSGDQVTSLHDLKKKPATCNSAVQSHCFDFTDLIELNTRWFVGRKKILTDLNKFTKKYDRGYYRIAASAGLGKTALAAKIVMEHDAAGFFFDISRGFTSTRQCLNHLIVAIVEQYALDNVDIPTDNPSKSSKLLSDVLKQASEKSSHPIWIVIDALDEANLPSPGQNILLLPRFLSEGVFFILTYRPGNYPLVVDPDTPLNEPIRIEPESVFQLKDIKKYLENQANRRPEIRAILKREGIDVKEFVSHLKDASQGNFMYLKYVLEDIAHKEPEYYPLNLKKLPQGLIGYYDQFWSRMKSRAYEENKHSSTALFESIIRLLAAAREPVTAEWLGRISNNSPNKIREKVLRPWLRFLVKGTSEGLETWRIVHKSFSDFLSDHVQENTKINLPSAHWQIAEYYINSWGSLNKAFFKLQKRLGNLNDDDRYGLRNLIGHLEHSDKEELAHTLLKAETSECNKNIPLREICVPHPKRGMSSSILQKYFLEHVRRKKTVNDNFNQQEVNHLENLWYLLHEKTDSISAYSNDIDRCWRLSESESESNMKKSELAAISLEVRYGLIHSSLISRARNLPSSLMLALLKHNMITAKCALENTWGMTAYELSKLLCGLIDDRNSDANVLETVYRYGNNIVDSHFRLKVFIRLAFIQQYALGEKALDSICDILNEEFNDSSKLLGHLQLIPNRLLPNSFVRLMWKNIENWKSIKNNNEIITELMRLSIIDNPIEVLDRIQRESADPSIQVDRLGYLAPHINSGQVLRKALQLAIGLRGEGWRSDALDILAPSLVKSPGRVELMNTAWKEAIKMRSDFSYAKAISAIAPYLDDKRQKDALERIKKIDDICRKTYALGRIAKSLPTSELRSEITKQVLELILMVFNSSYYRCRVQAVETLVDIRQNFNTIPHDSLQRTLSYLKTEWTLKLKHRALLFSALAPYFPLESSKLRHDAWVSALSFGDEDVINEVLYSFSKTQRQDELANTLNLFQSEIVYDHSVADKLAKIIPHIQDNKLNQVVSIAKKSPTKKAKLIILEELYAHLDSDQLYNTWYEITAIADSLTQTDVLHALLPHVGINSLGPLIENLITTYEEIPNPEIRQKNIITLVKKLNTGDVNEKEIRQVENILKRIKDRKLRSKAIEELGLPSKREQEEIEKRKNLLYSTEKELANVEYLPPSRLSYLAPYMSYSNIKEALVKAKQRDMTTNLKLQGVLVFYLQGRDQFKSIEDIINLIKIIRKDMKDRYDSLSTKALEYHPVLEYSISNRGYASSEDVKKECCSENIKQEIEIASILSKLLDIETTQKAQLEDQLNSAIDAISAIPDEQSKYEHLTEIAKHLPENIFKEILRWSMYQFHGKNLKQLAPLISQKCGLCYAYQLWKTVFRYLANKNREVALRGIETLLPVIKQLGEEKDIEEIYIAIIDVGQWWK